MVGTRRGLEKCPQLQLYKVDGGRAASRLTDASPAATRAGSMSPAELVDLETGDVVAIPMSPEIRSGNLDISRGADVADVNCSIDDTLLIPMGLVRKLGRWGGLGGGVLNVLARLPVIERTLSQSPCHNRTHSKLTAPTNLVKSTQPVWNLESAMIQCTVVVIYLAQVKMNSSGWPSKEKIVLQPGIGDEGKFHYG